MFDERLDKKIICDLQENWENCDPILKKSCTIMQDFQNLKDVPVVRDYQTIIKKNRDKFANVLLYLYWPPPDEGNKKLKDQIIKLRNICTQFENQIYTSMCVADKQIIRIIEVLQLQMKNKRGIEL